MLTNVPVLVRKATIMHYLRSVALTDVDITSFLGGIQDGELEQMNFLFGVLNLTEPGSAFLTVVASAGVCLLLSSAVVWTREFASQPSRSDD